MKINKLTIWIPLGIAFADLSAHAQTFQNLNFESATPSTPISGPLGPALYQPVALALPGWTAYLGAVQQTEVLQNIYTEGTAAVDLFGPSYPAADGAPGIIDGNYSVLLQAGAYPNSEALVSASIAQYGTVPLGSQSLQFKAWTTSATKFSVSFDGNTLSPIALGSGPNYSVLYGVNISSYAGDSGTLEFSALFVTPGTSWLGLDDISFSPTAVTPEPGTLTLLLMTVAAFGAGRWRAKGS